MMSLAVQLNNIFVWGLVIFVAIPLGLLTWLALGTVLSFVIGPLGYIVVLGAMIYYFTNG
jgi:hypothetical protein